MNDYLAAIATIEMTRTGPRTAWTHRPSPRRRKRAVAQRIAARLHLAPAPRPAAALP